MGSLQHYLWAGAAERVQVLTSATAEVKEGFVHDSFVAERGMGIVGVGVLTLVDVPHLGLNLTLEGAPKNICIQKEHQLPFVLLHTRKQNQTKASSYGSRAWRIM